MSESVQQENKMGTMPILKLLFSMALPMIVSMLIQALYNVIDSMYVSRISEEALTAVSLVFPMQNLMVAVASGTGVGVNALLSRALGAKDPDRANRMAVHGVFLAAVSYIVVGLFMYNFAPVFLSTQTDDPEIYQAGVTYMRIVGGLSVGMFAQMTFERLLNSTGRTFCTMISQGTGAIINIIMDPILIFGYFGLPAMGVAGAAAATVFGQCVAAILAIVMNQVLNKEVHLKFRGFRPQGRTILTIYKIALPSIIMQSIGSVMNFGINMILMQYLKSSTAAAVFGVYYKLNSMIFMPIFGLNSAMVPIIAYNYGAAHKKRILKTTLYSVIFAESIMLLGMALFLLIPDKLLLIYNASENMLEIGVPALRIICLSFIFAGVCIVLGSVMQAMGKAIYSMINSCTRQMVILLPIAMILAVVAGLDGVWWAFDIAEVSSFVITMCFFRKVYREMIAPLPD